MKIEDKRTQNMLRCHILHDANGKILIKSRTRNGIYHCEDGPARIEYYEDEKVKSEGWYRDGLPVREGGPAFITYFRNGIVKSETWCRDRRKFYDGNYIFRRTEYFNNGHLRSDIWYSSYSPIVKLGRNGGPAWIVYDKCGRMKKEEWWREGEKHEPSAHERMVWESVKEQKRQKQRDERIMAAAQAKVERTGLAKGIRSCSRGNER